MMWILLCVIIIAIIILHYIYLRRKLKDFSGPTPLPIVGNTLEFRKINDVIPKFMEYIDKYGGMVKFQINPLYNYILVTDHEFLKYLLSSQDLITKSDDYNFLSPWIGFGLLTSTGPKWKSHRRLITPAFHFSILESFVDVYEANGDIFMEKMRKYKNESSIDVFPLTKLCTLDIMLETSMGTRADAQINEHSEYVKAVETISRIIAERFLYLHKLFDITYQFTSDYKVQKKTLKILHDYTIKMIEDRQRIKKLNPDTITDVDDIGKKKKKTFIDILIQEENNLSIDEIREEVDTFLFEGHDTTSSLISFVMYLLADNLDVQEKLLEEQKSIFGDDLKSERVTYGHLQEMRYLEAVLKETLRLYPSVPHYDRRATRDIIYKDKLIPAGTFLWIFPYGVHRNPEFYPNPEVFDPDRFLEKDIKSPYAFLPFSAGPRNCIGQKFAMLVAKSIISKMIRNFILKPSIPRKDIIPMWELVLILKMVCIYVGKNDNNSNNFFYIEICI